MVSYLLPWGLLLLKGGSHRRLETAECKLCPERNKRKQQNSVR